MSVSLSSMRQKVKSQNYWRGGRWCRILDSMTIQTTRSIGARPDWDLTDKLRKAREHAGMEQGQLAEALGVSGRTIGRYEQGAPVKRATLIAWSMATGVALDWLMNEESPSPDGARLSSGCTPRDLNPKPSD
ncbi:helix-turn-helix domain-containing protein [Arthrobacter sp. HLT1-21]